MTILVDMDDTMECLLEAWIARINAIHNLNVQKCDIKEWDLRVAFPTLTQEEIFAPINTVELWQNVKPKDGAVKYLKQLIADGHNIIVVTASHYDSVALKMKEVLFKHFPFIPYEDVIITSRKQLINGDVLIDDAPHNLVGGTYKPILFNAPHNQELNAEKYGMIRVNSWEEVYQAIKDIEDKELDTLLETLPNCN